MQVFAQLLETERVGFHLLRGDFFSTLMPWLRAEETANAARLLLCRSASCLGNETRVRFLNQRNASLDRFRIVFSRRTFKPATARIRLRTSLHQKLHHRRVAMKLCDVENSESAIAAELVVSSH